MAPARPQAEVKTNSDGSVTIEYMACHSGAHELSLNYNQQPVAGTPIKVNVDSMTHGKFICAYGQGLSHGASGDELEFYVTGHPNDIAVKIDGAGQANIVRKEEKGGKLHVVYMPMSPGEYNVAITNKGKPIHGSPFLVKVTGEGRKRSQLSVPATSDYVIGGNVADLANVTAFIKTPDGHNDPCLLKKMADNRLAITGFQPKVKGKYAVQVKKDGHDIKGSPFSIQISDLHVCKSKHVKISGAYGKAIANQDNEVNIDIGDAGFGALAISIEGAHRSNVDIKNVSQTQYCLVYRPHEPGVYLLNIKFGDDHITGSPFVVDVGGQPSGRIRETTVVEVQNAEPAFPGQNTGIILKIPGTDPLDMDATLTSPSGKTEACEIRGLGEWLANIKFSPTEEGVHIISLKQKGIHFAGSPYQFTVGKTPAGGTHKVEFGGPGTEKGEVHAKNEFNVYTREAGAGTLSISIEGPSKAKLQAVDRQAGYITVSYVVDKEGDYGIHVKFNDQHVPESPCSVHVTPESKDAKKLTVHGLMDHGLEVGKPATFRIKMNGARGTLKGHVHTPSGLEEDVFIQDLDEEEFAVRFLPKENGVYYVHMLYNDTYIPDSPFPMLIGKLGADPALVFANGDGLDKGQTGKPSKFNVVTSSAGPGTLVVSIDGPSKVALSCSETDEGYEFVYTPNAPGDYMILVRYCNITIAGAPFKATVSGSGKRSDIVETSELFVEAVEKKPGAVKAKHFVGDASKVVAHGNGLKKGFAGRASTFTLDVKDAGQALLTMGIMAPSGNPVTEISWKKQRQTLYLVSYKADEKGDHTLSIRWGNDEIPGSPFSLQVN